MQRSQTVGDYQGYYQACGCGHPEPSHVNFSGNAEDVNEAVRKEIVSAALDEAHDETGIPRGDFCQVPPRLLGIQFDSERCDKPDLVFSTTVRWSTDQVLAFHADAREKDEAEQVFCLARDEILAGPLFSAPFL
jgi:hypothetical protein